MSGHKTEILELLKKTTNPLELELLSGIRDDYSSSFQAFCLLSEPHTPTLFSSIKCSQPR